MMNKPPPSSSSKPNPTADEKEDEKLWQLSGEWMHRLCECGHTSYSSNPERIANLAKEGNENLGLRIKIDMPLFERLLRVTDAEMIQFSRQNCSSSSSPPGEGELGQQQQQQQEEVLFIRRELKASDIRKEQNRLSMPCRQAKEEGVLREDEVEMMRRGMQIPVELVGPNGRKYDVKLKLTKAGLKSCSYAIGKPWNEIRKDNGLEEGMVLNIWTSRGPQRQLRFHLRTDHHPP